MSHCAVQLPAAPFWPHGWQCAEEHPSGDILAVGHSDVAFPPAHPAVIFDAAKAWLPIRRGSKASSRAPRAIARVIVRRGISEHAAPV